MDFWCVKMGLRHSGVFFSASGRSFRGFERDFSKVLNLSLATVEMTYNQADYMVHGPCSYGCAYGAGPNLNRKIILLWRRSG